MLVDQHLRLHFGDMECMRIFQRRLHVWRQLLRGFRFRFRLVLPLHIAQNSPCFTAQAGRIEIAFRRVERCLLFLAGGDDKRPQVRRQFVFRAERQRFALAVINAIDNARGS